MGCGFSSFGKEGHADKAKHPGGSENDMEGMSWPQADAGSNHTTHPFRTTRSDRKSHHRLQPLTASARLAALRSGGGSPAERQREEAQLSQLGAMRACGGPTEESAFKGESSPLRSVSMSVWEVGRSEPEGWAVTPGIVDGKGKAPGWLKRNLLGSGQPSPGLASWRGFLLISESFIKLWL